MEHQLLTSDTIAAVATPPGRGGVGVVRVSGPKVVEIAQQVIGRIPVVRKAEYAEFKDRSQEVVDAGIVIRFQGPQSFTGEDVLELQGHGGPVILDSLLKTVLACGARVARPGEFTERAFLNNKIDLVQAEAVAAAIDAGSQQAAKAAIRSLQGIFSKKIEGLVEGLIQLRLYVEAAIDFPEEEIDFLSNSHVLSSIEQLDVDIAQIVSTAKQGALLSEGMTLVLAGRPNAGKSSLLNQLTGEDTAIVTHVPGTTRDVIKARIALDGLLLNVIDTAGLRETDDVVEIEGIKRTRQEAEMADVVMIVVDAVAEPETNPFILQPDLMASLSPSTKIIVVHNKIDQLSNAPCVVENNRYSVLSVSAKTGVGIDVLRQYVKRFVGFADEGEQQFIARRRHLEALEVARKHIQEGRSQLEVHAAGELLAEELRLAQEVLCEITGEFTSDDLLGRIFSEFCIGK